MTAFKSVVRMLSILALVTGAIDMIGGVHLLIAGGGRLESVARDPVLNSQVGFWGAIWFGFGIVLWRATRGAPDRALLRILFATVILSGLARLFAALIYGLPGLALTSAMVVEIGAGLALLMWNEATGRVQA